MGYNGAGKTTLTNLLLRLYDVTEGAITLDGVNIKDWDINSYHRNFAAVFQDFSLFGATLGENVSMNDSPDSKKAEKALEAASFDRELPNGTNKRTEGTQGAKNQDCSKVHQVSRDQAAVSAS